jgi:aminoglycoside phosphotransferase (APT) family kinase protein
MNPQKLHQNEPDISPDLVQHLIKTQFPDLANQPLRLLAAGGTENVLYRLGTDFLLRFPRMDWAVAPLEKDSTWLGYVAPHLPLEIPTQIALGKPSAAYSFPWGVYKWLEGQDLFSTPTQDLYRLAHDLAGFIKAMQQIPIPQNPPPSRAKPLFYNDEAVRENLALLPQEFKPHILENIWRDAVALPIWDGTPVWSHGDLHGANLLARDGKISAVIDFGTLGVGDPRFDYALAWWVLDAPSRAEFRRLLGVDDVTWSRARGQAVCGAALAYPYYKDTNPVLTGIAAHSMQQILLDHQGEP